jgi:hypothetical protein
MPRLQNKRQTWECDNMEATRDVFVIFECQYSLGYESDTSTEDVLA